MLYKKLHDIDSKGNRAGIYNNNARFEYKKNVKDGNKKKEIVKMAQENLHMLKRLQEKTSHYNFYKYEKDYDRAQYYKRSHCAFPSIDFYKTQRANSFGVKSPYSPYNSQNNYFPNVTPKVFIVNSRKKRFEDFHYEDFADIKTISKKDKLDNNKKKKEENNKKKEKNEKNEENKNKVDNNKKDKNIEESHKNEDEIKNEKNNENEENEKIKKEKKIEEKTIQEKKNEENNDKNNSEEEKKNDKGNNQEENKNKEQNNDKKDEQKEKQDNKETNEKKADN